MIEKDVLIAWLETLKEKLQELMVDIEMMMAEIKEDDDCPACRGWRGDE